MYDLEIARSYPFLRFCIYFLSGIVVGLHVHVHFASSNLLLLSVLGLLIIITLFLRKILFQSILISVSILFLGFSLPIINKSAPRLTPSKSGIQAYKVDSWIKRHESGISFISLDSHNTRISTFLEDTNCILKYGDVFISKAMPQLIKPTNNPYLFDFAGYWEKKEVYYSLFIKDQVLHVDNQPSNLFLQKAFDVRNKLIDKIDHRIKGHRARSVAKALLIGVREEINENDMKSFRKAGVAHIISISGLHVGILLGFCMGLSRFIYSIKVRRFIIYPVIILILWFYAFVAGFSTSIIRAALMCSIILLGKIISSKPSGLNSLFVTAFIVLTINPNQLLEVGFQLSFMAVLGIMVFYKPLMNIVHSNNKLVRSIISVVFITLAAQITTTPLLIYYFNEFSVVSIISNLILVPFSSLMVGAGFLFSALSLISLDILASYSSIVFEFTINVFTHISGLLGSLSFSNISNLRVELYEMFFYFALLVTIYTLLFIPKRIIRSKAFLGCLIILLCHFGLNSCLKKKELKIAVFKDSQHVWIDIQTPGGFKKLNLRELAKSEWCKHSTDSLFDVFYIEGISVLIFNEKDQRNLTEEFLTKFDLVIDPGGYHLVSNLNGREDFDLKTTYFEIIKTYESGIIRD